MPRSIGNLTVTSTAGPGYLRLYPTGTPSTTSSINYTGSDQTVANGVTVGLSLTGFVTIECQVGGADVIFDATGFIS